MITPSSGKRVTQGTGGALGDPVGVPGFGGVQGLEFQRGHREQRQRRNAQLDPVRGLFQQQINGQALDARHRGDGFATVFTVQHEDRQDQIIDGQYVFTDQTTRKIIAAVAAQAGCRKQDDWRG